MCERTETPEEVADGNGLRRLPKEDGIGVVVVCVACLQAEFKKIFFQAN